MNNTRPRFGTSGPLAAATRVAAGLAMALWLATPAAAALPPAGSIIGNQASATYTDFSGQSKSATSNLVETTVTQVGAFALAQDNTKTAAVGNTVYMAHTLTNTGNGSDTFKLSLTDNAGTFAASNLAIYADANGDGVPDNTTALCVGVAACTNYVTPSLPANGTFKFVVSMTVPASAGNGNSDNITVTATPGTVGLYTTASQSNTDTLNVTSTAAFQVNKSISASQGATGVTLTYTLTYKNVGAAIGNLALQDVIGAAGSPTAGYSYVAGSAKWSAGGASLNDNALVAATPDRANIGGMDAYYEAITAGSTTTIKANINKVGPNVTGTVTFDVLVLGTALPGTSTTTNTGSFAVDDDLDPTNNGALTLQSTNPSPYNVLSNYSVVANDGTAAAADGSNTRPLSTDADAGNADLLRVLAASPGQTITFNNVIWNTGNSTDTFNITAAGLPTLAGSSNAWPTGTTFQLFKTDGSSPLLDSNGDGVPDTGALTSGSPYTVVVKVTLPTGACPAGVCPTGPFDVEVKAQSVGNPDPITGSNTTYDRLVALTAPTVDLANESVTANPAVNHQAIGATPTTTRTVLPGQTTTFDLYVRNEGLIPDTYDLAYSGTNAFSPATALPAGWTVQFRAGACSAAGSVITFIPVANGDQQRVCAVVTVPANAPADTTNVYFQVVSQVTGASDAKWDAVTVSSVNSLTVAPSGTGQVYPGGTIVYPHTVTNTGNTSCGTSFTFTISESLAAQGWTYVLYKDANGDGRIDSGDAVLSSQVVSTTTLAPAAQFKILVKVFAPAGAAAATTDVVSLSVSSTCGGTPDIKSNTATDTTTVVTGQVRLLKTQALNADCTAGTTPVAADFKADMLTAKPGQCIIYKVVATNEGLGDVTGLRLLDSLPAYTEAFLVPSLATNPVCSAGTASYAASQFSCVGVAPDITLKPAESVTITFSVKVSQ